MPNQPVQLSQDNINYKSMYNYRWMNKQIN